MILKDAIEQGEKGIEEVRKYFPADVLDLMVKDLAKEELQRYKAILSKIRVRLHNPEDPFYDLSLIKDGMKVINRLTERKGIVKIDKTGPNPVVDVLYESGVSGQVYPNQISLLEE